MSEPGTTPKAIIVQSQEEERYRLARALQSGAGQLFANAALEIDSSLRLMSDQPEAARQGLVALADELRRGLAELRELIDELDPPLIREFGLLASLKKYASDLSSRCGIQVSLEGWNELTARLPSTMEIAIFRIVQEALDNVRTHAHATRVSVRLTQSPDRISVAIEDNGRGFAAQEDTVPLSRRLGLVAMSDRAELLGGQLQVFSEPSRGVRVVLSVPFRARVN